MIQAAPPYGEHGAVDRKNSRMKRLTVFPFACFSWPSFRICRRCSPRRWQHPQSVDDVPRSAPPTTVEECYSLRSDRFPFLVRSLVRAVLCVLSPAPWPSVPCWEQSLCRSCGQRVWRELWQNSVGYGVLLPLHKEYVVFVVARNECCQLPPRVS